MLLPFFNLNAYGVVCSQCHKYYITTHSSSNLLIRCCMLYIYIYIYIYSNYT